MGNGCGHVSFSKKKAMEKCTILKFLLTRFNMVHVYFYDAEAAFEFMANWNILKKNCTM